MRVLVIIYGFFASFFVGAASTSPINPKKALDEWTLSNAHRYSSNNYTQCDWVFEITSKNGQGPLENCQFTVTTPIGQDCRNTTFSNQPCGSDDNWLANAGESPMGFVVMVLVNTDMAAQAYFGFDDVALNSNNYIPKQIMHAYPLGSQRRSSFGSQGEPSQVQWKVNDLFRVFDQATGVLYFSFRVMDGTPIGTHCNLNLIPPKSTDPLTWSWYAEKCQDSDYTVSWGYNMDTDSAVMTLVLPEEEINAFFGWDHVSQTPSLGSKGPFPAIPM